ncbi:PREDICTED: ADP-ribosylation factor-like protein 4C [Colobus angolensis palliatus]|nr:PREDICTED: ADP-ribosylation factor-like protein 4C [Colobus angolensis palliatus]
MGNISSNISAFQSLHIVMLGLDSAGKTTVLYRLKFNEFVNTVPTIGFNTEKIKLSNGTAKGISCHFWDVGGQEKLRPLWKSYSRCTDGIIYVVDSVDVDRLEEAKTELHKVTKFAENQGTPLLVIANKQDLPKSLPVAEIEKQLALHELIPATTYHVQPACAIIGEGLTEGMDKLYEMILKRRKSLKQKKKRTGDLRSCEGLFPGLLSTCPPPPAQGTFCLNARATEGVGRRWWGVEVPVLLSALPVPVGRLNCWRDKSDFFLLLQGQKFRLPRPHWGIAPVSYLRYAFPRILGVPTWGACWLLGDHLSLHSGAVKLSNFRSQGRPLLKFHLSCSGPKGGDGLGHQRTAWDGAAGTESCAGLAGDGRGDALFLVLCGGCRRPVLLRTAFQPGIRHLPDGLDPIHV